MPIKYFNHNRSFHIQHSTTSLILSIEALPSGYDTVLFRHYSAPASVDCLQDDELARDRWISFDTFHAAYPYAFPTAGHGDFRPAQLAIQDKDGISCTLMHYAGYEILAGKRVLNGLPATYVELESEATTLALLFNDSFTGANARCEYTLFEDTGAIAISCIITNNGDAPITLTKAMSVSITLPNNYELLHLHGAWARECTIERVPAMHGERVIRSRRGASSHQHNPFAALLPASTTELAGEVYGVSLVYSGSYSITVEQDALDQTRLVAGINEEAFAWPLAPSESFETPEAVLIYSSNGLNNMSQRYHTLYRTRLCKGYWRDRARPILFNNWEATYFDFNQDTLLNIAKSAADLGAELFVLDDGWFGKRNDDTSSLGDWFEDFDKLPGGIKELSDKIHSLGLQLGLWFEPEMISINSQLYTQYPDWVLCAPLRPMTPSRTQHILDFSRADVQDYIISTVSEVLQRGGVDYVKWDMNRHFSEIGSAQLSPQCQTGMHHRYILGVYRVMAALVERHPKVLFEGCSGGGGRLDPGMMYYMPQIWISDNSDAIARLSIQYGASLVYPPSAMCCHVSAVPNHQVQRVTSLDLRGKVAMNGVLGYQLDPTTLSSKERKEISDQIVLYKELRPIIALGTLTRLQSPFEQNCCAWQIVHNQDILVFVFQILQVVNRLSMRLRLHCLDDGKYVSLPDNRIYSSVDLCSHGLVIPLTRPHDQELGDFCGVMLHFKRIDLPTEQ